MPLKVRCPNCKKVLVVPDAARGKAVRCKDCQGRVPIPAGTSKPKTAEKKAKRPVGTTAGHDDDFLANLDLAKLEDTGARVCPRCGADVPEGEIDCPQCGVNIETGRLGERALREKRRRELRGPDPADYYRLAWTDSWQFVCSNSSLVRRTVLYWLIFSCVALGCAYMFLWCHRTPPKAFWAFLTFVAAMVPFGWSWFLTTTIVQATLDKKDELKRINFDFFLCAALGIKFFAWQIAFVQLVTGGIGFWLIQNGNALGGGISIGIGVFLCFVMFPIAMAHMSMPVTYPGWLLPLVLKDFFASAAGVLYWSVVCLATLLPALGCVGAAGAVYGRSITGVVDTLRFNSVVAAAKETEAPKPTFDAEKKLVPADDPMAQFRTAEPRPVDATPLIVPAVLWLFTCVFLGFGLVFNMRSTGQFVVHYRRGMELIVQEKEVKYVAKAKDEDEKKIESSVNVVWALAALAFLGGLGAGFYTDNLMLYGVIGALYAVSFIPLAGMWRVFEKAGQPGWATLVPIYNMVVMHRVAGKPEWWVLLYFVPIVGLVVAVIVCIGIAEQFGQGAGFGIGLAFLGFVFFPLLGFGNFEYQPAAR